MSLRIIAGQFKGRSLRAPKGPSTRPTQSMLRESVFNICQHEIQGARFLDLFAGSGAMGLEALSRGALHATFVESDRRAIASIRENIATLQVASETTLITSNAEQALKHLFSPFHIIYVDPPYDKPVVPYIKELLDRNLIAPDGILFIEERNRPNPPSLHFPELILISTRRFGEALLHQYRFSATTQT